MAANASLASPPSFPSTPAPVLPTSPPASPLASLRSRPTATAATTTTTSTSATTTPITTTTATITAATLTDTTTTTAPITATATATAATTTVPLSTSFPPPCAPGNTIVIPAAETRAISANLRARRLPEGHTAVVACVLTSARTLELSARVLPPPPPGYVQVRLVSTTLCGSDLHYYHAFRNGEVVPRGPLILGHESCGVVTAVGSGAVYPAAGAETDINTNPLQPGDLVALEVGISCDGPECLVCLPVAQGGLGRYNVCPNMRFRSSGLDGAGGGLLEGTLQGGLNHPAKWCHRLPQGFNPYLGSLLEPLAVAIHATGRLVIPEISARIPITTTSTTSRMASTTPIQQAILVLGAGPVGLLIAACLKKVRFARASASGGPRPKIVILDLVHSRLDFAVHELGWADTSILLTPQLLALPPPELLAYLYKRLYGTLGAGTRVEAVFECTGVANSLQLACHLPSPGGKLLVLTIPPSMSTVPLGMATLREVDILGAFRYGPGDYQRAVEVVRKGSIRGLEKMISHVVRGLTSAKDGLELLAKGIDNSRRPVIKVVVEADEADWGDGALQSAVWEWEGNSEGEGRKQVAEEKTGEKKAQKEKQEGGGDVGEGGDDDDNDDNDNDDEGEEKEGEGEGEGRDHGKEEELVV